jgi:hypothetical protein
MQRPPLELLLEVLPDPELELDGPEQAPATQVSPVCEQSEHDRPPVPHKVSAPLISQLPLLSQQPLHEAGPQEPPSESASGAASSVVASSVVASSPPVVPLFVPLALELVPLPGALLLESSPPPELAPVPEPTPSEDTSPPSPAVAQATSPRTSPMAESRIMLEDGSNSMASPPSPPGYAISESSPGRPSRPRGSDADDEINNEGPPSTMRDDNARRPSQP